MIGRRGFLGSLAALFASTALAPVEAAYKTVLDVTPEIPLANVDSLSRMLREAYPAREYFAPFMDETAPFLQWLDAENDPLRRPDWPATLVDEEEDYAPEEEDLSLYERGETVG